MNKLNPIFFAGAVAQATGVSPITLRHYRDRGFCDFGHVIEGGEDNPRSRRRYDVREACMIGIAVSLSRFGVDLEQAFSIASKSQSIEYAIEGALKDADKPDCILCYVGANNFAEDDSAWGNFVVLPLPDWKANAATAFEATDAFPGGDPAEVLLSVNVSAIARRVIKALCGSDEG
ncbi:conserved hypothetical protein [Agrobacterium genomosp. 5 str. CFBP 6626]|nr:conserved hypothetical protein [Agrobacterium genomosp. 5 str. CFBP 6626]